MYTIYVQRKRPGRKEQLAPEAISLLRRPDTLRELIEALVRQQVEDYNARKDRGQLLGWLTKEEIEEKAQEGRISFGLQNGRDGDAGQAVANAIQCFEDGIYRVFAGKRELTELDGEIPWEPDTVFSIIRLTMLAGW